MLNALGQISGSAGALGGTAQVGELQASLNSLSLLTGGTGVSVTGEVTPATVSVLASALGDLGLPDSLLTILEMYLPYAQAKSSYMVQAQTLIEQYATTLTPLVLALIERLKSPPKKESTGTYDECAGLSPVEQLHCQDRKHLPNYKAPVVFQPEPLVIDPWLHRSDRTLLWVGIGAAAIVGGAFVLRLVRN